MCECRAAACHGGQPASINHASDVFVLSGVGLVPTTASATDATADRAG
jgi:hypothetical protein